MQNSLFDQRFWLGIAFLVIYAVLFYMPNKPPAVVWIANVIGFIAALMLIIWLVTFILF